MNETDILIPPRTTPFCQPAYLMWMKLLKAKYHVKWTHWLLNDRKAFTKRGFLKSPGYIRAMKWCIEAWNELDREIIIRSFEKTGITCSNEENFNSVLRFVMRESNLPGSIVEEEHESDELNGFNFDAASNSNSSFQSNNI